MKSARSACSAMIRSHSSCGRLHPERDAVAAEVRRRLEHELLAVVGDERQQVDRPVAVGDAAGAQDPRPRDRRADDVRLVALDQVGEARVLEQREQLLVVGDAGAERVDEADAPVARGGDEVGLVEVLEQRAAVDEVDGLVLDPQRRAVVGDVVERRVEGAQARRLGGGADDPELGDAGRAGGVDEREPRPLRQLGPGGADVRVGVEQRGDQLGQDRRVGGVELLPHAREVDRGAQALVEDVRVADAGGRVGVELEELDVVALQERVEPADAHRAREARRRCGSAGPRCRGAGARRAGARRSDRRRRSGRAPGTAR